MDIGNGRAREGGMEGVQGERRTQAAMCGDMCAGENVGTYTWGGERLRRAIGCASCDVGKRLRRRKQCSRGFEREDWREGRDSAIRLGYSSLQHQNWKRHRARTGGSWRVGLVGTMRDYGHEEGVSVDELTVTLSYCEPRNRGWVGDWTGCVFVFSGSTSFRDNRNSDGAHTTPRLLHDIAESQRVGRAPMPFLWALRMASSSKQIL
ncbi:hypothetical protein FB45DRAFT_877699 [Roridomyces roridus]|uniref:Uncharacterized protein n=1 Tax=Roridomyces roridus TaxID=1738132 RepID=A0AAD7B1J1_9AGAR|nr:hypothetical protein FB45DRAFT_877699 [Roridomyces roridus]